MKSKSMIGCINEKHVQFKLPAHFRAIALGVICMLAAAMLMSSCGLGQVSDERIEQDVRAEILTTGSLMRSAYLNETPYELVEFTVADRTTETGEFFGRDFEMIRASFSGIAKNESIETTFNGHAYYQRENNEWVLALGPQIDSKTSVPLKGIDFVDENTSLRENETISELQIAFDSTNGYSSIATQTITIDRWFTDDVATKTQKYSFDESSGWKKDGGAEIIKTNSTYKLTGKSFECTTNPGEATDEGKVTYTITFTDSKEDGTITADYSIAYDAATSRHNTRNLGNYVSLDKKSTLSGKIEHSIDSESFSVELNDPVEKITFSCTSSRQVISAGTGTVNAMEFKITSDIVFFDYTDPSSKDGVLRQSVFRPSDTFVEVL
jgi:hypothetical protein